MKNASLCVMMILSLAGAVLLYNPVFAMQYTQTEEVEIHSAQAPIEGQSAPRDIFLERVNAALLSDKAEHIGLGYAGHYMDPYEDILHLYWAFDSAAASQGEKREVIAALGLQEFTVEVIPARFTSKELRAVRDIITEKVYTGEQFPAYGVIGDFTDTSLNRVIVSISEPFEKNQKAFLENVIDTDAVLFRLSNYEGTLSNPIPHCKRFAVRDATSVPLQIFRLGARVDFTWEPCKKAARYRYQIVRVDTEQVIVKGAYTKEQKGFLPEERNAQGGMYRLAIQALNLKGEVIKRYRSIFYTGRAEIQSREKLTPYAISFSDTHCIGMILGSKTSQDRYGIYHDRDGGEVFAPPFGALPLP